MPRELVDSNNFERAELKGRAFLHEFALEESSQRTLSARFRIQWNRLKKFSKDRELVEGGGNGRDKVD